MCGIFGVHSKLQLTAYETQNLKSIFKKLTKLSTARGKEASGFIIDHNNACNIYKSSNSAYDFIRTLDIKNVLSKIEETDHSLSLLGHSRLVTNGIGALNTNNQPIFDEKYALFHNGIIANEAALKDEFELDRAISSDTQVLFEVGKALDENFSSKDAIQNLLDLVEGTASCSLYDIKSKKITLFSDNGSLYFTKIFNDVIIYASEKYILEQALNKHGNVKIVQVKPGQIYSFEDACKPLIETKIIINMKSDFPNMKEIKRCAKCLLPITFPGIYFNSEGVCSECISYEKNILSPLDVLRKKLDRHRSQDGSPDCLVGLSGGRDSCYGLHVIKKEFEMNPIAFTYDWGLVTDLARRNIARMCGKLGVEHILISADIKRKRSNVRKNIDAWLGMPELGMIPLFMAGDKHFYKYAHILRKQNKIKLFFFAAGNRLETTHFKARFAGLAGASNKGILTSLSVRNKFLMINYYLRNFIAQPKYINSSIFDTISAFNATYMLKDDYEYLYHYYPWDEDTINSTLQNQYNWEKADDSTSTWRIGDGTAAFYNYVYFVVAGFTEHDTFRSNQIREGELSRSEAFERLLDDNQPRWESLEWYAKTIGFNLNDALSVIHKMEKLY